MAARAVVLCQPQAFGPKYRRKFASYSLTSKTKHFVANPIPFASPNELQDKPAANLKKHFHCATAGAWGLVGTKDSRAAQVSIRTWRNILSRCRGLATCEGLAEVKSHLSQHALHFCVGLDMRSIENVPRAQRSPNGIQFSANRRHARSHRS